MVSYVEQNDEWYDLFQESSLDDQYTMLIEILESIPNDNQLIEEDFATLVLDVQEGLVRYRQFDELVQLAETAKEKTPNFYAEEGPYVNKWMVEYYLFKNEPENYATYLQVFGENPVKAYDLFLSLLKKIRLYLNEGLEMKLIQETYEPVIHSGKLIDGAEADLEDAVFYRTIQHYYLSLRNGEELSWDDVITSLKKYEYEDDLFKEELSHIQSALDRLLQNEGKPFYTVDEWETELLKDPRRTSLDLFWPFAVYMYDYGGFPFSVSHLIWRYYCRLLGSSKIEGFTSFSFNYNVLEELLAEMTGFLSFHDEEAFGLLWGLPYVYDFLEKQQLVTDAVKDRALKHIKKAKGRLMDKYEQDLWQHNYVHTWKKPLSVTEEEFQEEAKIFEQSFSEKPEKPEAPFVEEKTFSQQSLFDFLANNQSSPVKKPRKQKGKRKKKQKTARKKKRKK